MFGDRCDHEVVVVALGQAGDDDRADAFRACEEDRKASAMCSVIGEREAVMRFEGLLVELKLSSDRVRAACEVVNGVALAADPVGLSWASRQQWCTQKEVGRRARSLPCLQPRASAAHRVDDCPVAMRCPA